MRRAVIFRNYACKTTQDWLVLLPRDQVEYIIQVSLALMFSFFYFTEKIVFFWKNMRSKLTLYNGNDEFMIFVSVSDIRTHNFLLCEITISQIQNVSLDLMEIFSKELLYS